MGSGPALRSRAARAVYDAAFMLNLSYGIWTFQSRNPLRDRRVCREDRSGDQRQSRFYRAAGVRYRGTAKAGALVCHGGLVGFGKGVGPRTPADLLDGFFAPGMPRRHRMHFRQGSARKLARSKGCAILSAMHLRHASVPGLAEFIGVVRVRLRADGK